MEKKRIFNRPGEVRNLRIKVETDDEVGKKLIRRIAEEVQKENRCRERSGLARLNYYISWDEMESMNS